MRFANSLPGTCSSAVVLCASARARGGEKKEKNECDWRFRLFPNHYDRYLLKKFSLAQIWRWRAMGLAH
jgi:hypothetical protein